MNSVKTSPLVLFCFLNALLLLSVLNSLFTFPRVYPMIMNNAETGSFICDALSEPHPQRCVCLSVCKCVCTKHLWKGANVNQRTQLVVVQLWRCFIPEMACCCRGECRESAGPPRSTLVLPWDQLPFISPSPQGAQQQTTDGGSREKNIEEGTFWPGGDDSKVYAFPARGQLVLFILVCVLENWVSTLPFFPLSFQRL